MSPVGRGLRWIGVALALLAAAGWLIGAVVAVVDELGKNFSPTDNKVFAVVLGVFAVIGAVRLVMLARVEAEVLRGERPAGGLGWPALILVLCAGVWLFAWLLLVASTW